MVATIRMNMENRERDVEMCSPVLPKSTFFDLNNIRDADLPEIELVSVLALESRRYDKVAATLLSPPPKKRSQRQLYPSM